MEINLSKQEAIKLRKNVKDDKKIKIEEHFDGLVGKRTLVIIYDDKQIKDKDIKEKKRNGYEHVSENLEKITVYEEVNKSKLIWSGMDRSELKLLNKENKDKDVYKVELYYAKFSKNTDKVYD